MAEEGIPADSHQTPRVYRAPSEETEVETDQREYILQLESRMQEMNERMHELERERDVYKAAGESSEPPGFSIPQNVPMFSEFVPPPQPPQYYYPYPMPGMYPNPYQMYPPPPIEKKKCSFKQFLNCKPPEYKGSANPTITLNWLREVDRALDACQCEPELRVLYASRLFKDQAMIWWDSITTHLSKEQLGNVSWEQFHNKVREQYCTSFDIDKIRREFMNLELTEDMTVDELIVQFNDKLRFVQQWVPDEASRVYHFVNALPPEYRTVVRLAPTLTQAFVMAKMAESDIKAGLSRRREKASYQQQEQRPTASSQSSSKSKKSIWSKLKGQFNSAKAGSGSGLGTRWCSQCRANHSGSCTPATRRCLKCGISGHEAHACSYRNQVCWSCHQEGHRSADCPIARRVGSELGSRTGSAGGSFVANTGQKRKNPPTAEGRAFQMTVDVATATDNVMAGMFLINIILMIYCVNLGINYFLMIVAFSDILMRPIAGLEVVLGWN